MHTPSDSAHNRPDPTQNPLDQVSIARLFVEMPRFNEQVRRQVARLAPSLLGEMTVNLNLGDYRRYRRFARGELVWLTIPELVQIHCFLSEQPVPPFKYDMDSKGRVTQWYPRSRPARLRAQDGLPPALSK